MSSRGRCESCRQSGAGEDLLTGPVTFDRRKIVSHDIQCYWDAEAVGFTALERRSCLARVSRSIYKWKLSWLGITLVGWTSNRRWPAFRTGDNGRSKSARGQASSFSITLDMRRGGGQKVGMEFRRLSDAESTTVCALRKEGCPHRMKWVPEPFRQWRSIPQEAYFFNIS